MDTSNWLLVISIGIGIAQGIIIVQNKSFKEEIRQLWARADSHGHKIECDAQECKARTTAVIINEG
ncbi:MAG: hypothetical protein A4E68_01780 [Syntrophaceae bacterium PtaB.Bin095]|jgi:hypothetical protein|nr:MAG: hypothetical protein A4E68_01780 [Syntrophaceae bacterium PtaB.Bin095]